MKLLILTSPLTVDPNFSFMLTMASDFDLQVFCARLVMMISISIEQIGFIKVCCHI